eukprot:147078-Ditylum_brightwellii.AAC.1
MDTHHICTEYVPGGYPMFQHIRAIKKHEQPTLNPEEATIWVVLCMAKAEQHQRATARHQCCHETARHDQGLLGPTGQQLE